jgi:hypothetical protein
MSGSPPAVFAQLRVIDQGAGQPFILHFHSDEGDESTGRFDPGKIQDWADFLLDYQKRKNSPDELVGFGRWLFDVTLGQPDLLGSWQSMRSATRGRPLHLTIAFSGETDPFAMLPLELLHETGRDDRFLFAEPGAVLVRTLLKTTAHEWTTPEQPRVLFAWACPSGSGPVFKGEEHFARVQQVVPGAAELRRATRDDLKQRLQQRDVDYLFLMAHGWRDGHRTGVYLGDSSFDKCPASDLAGLLHESGVLLVFLCSCQTGHSAKDDSAGMFSGVAFRLLRDVPCVVAMQANLPIAGSSELASRFLDRLSKGLGPAEAVAQARSVYHQGDPVWSVPVVYLRPRPSQTSIAPPLPQTSDRQASDELQLLQQRIDRLAGLAGDFPERMTNCLQVAGSPPQAVALARSEAERLVKQVLEKMSIKAPAMLDGCLRELEKDTVMSRGLVPLEVVSLLHAIRVLGNKATHDALKIDLTADAVHLVLLALVRVVEWYFAEFERGPKVKLPGRGWSVRRPGVPWQSQPLLLTHYVRRPVEELRLERDLLREDEQRGVVVSAVFGMGGIGKSTLAAAVVDSRAVRDRFGDGMLWVLLGQEPNPLSLVGQCIRDLGDHEFRAMDLHSASERLRQLLQDRAVLLVVDDAWQSEHVEPFCVGGPRCRLLVTTRKAWIADHLRALRHELDVLSLEHSLDLLANWLRRPLRDDERGPALQLAKAVGRLPKALELVAVRIGHGLSWAGLLEKLKEEEVALEALVGPTERWKRKSQAERGWKHRCS